MQVDKTLEARGELLLQNLPLLSFNKEVVIKTLGDVIFKLFFNGITIGHTYIPSENWEVQKTGKKRTIEDCFLIAKTYFPEISYTQVQNAVESFYNIKAKVKPQAINPLSCSNLEMNISILTRGFCGDVQRNVHYNYSANFGAKQSIEYINDLLNNSNLNYGDFNNSTEAREVLNKEEIVLQS